MNLYIFLTTKIQTGYGFHVGGNLALIGVKMRLLGTPK
jgi:hypothetical protein